MESETAISKADFFLREIADVKTSNAPVDKKPIVKEELQYLRLNNKAQDEIMETLQFIHGPNFKLKDAKDYEDVRANLSKKYWIGEGLVVKGGYDFSQIQETSRDEGDRLKQFALMRLESYGFHKNHCIEALHYCESNVEDALYLLYNKYFNTDNIKDLDCNLTEKDLLEQRLDEKSSLQSIYDEAFIEKVPNLVWIITLKLNYLIEIFHNKNLANDNRKITITNSSDGKKKEKCRNFLRGHCKFGNKCRFSHELPTNTPQTDSHLNDFVFELEIRFPLNTKYPYEPPLIFLKTNAILPNLINLHLCKRLYQEAKLLAEDGIPSVYTIVELLQNDDEMKNFLKNPPNFLDPNLKLFPNIDLNNLIKTHQRPSHYKKGLTNRDNKKLLNINELLKIDGKIVETYCKIIKDQRYLNMLENRRKLPAWDMMKNILNEIDKAQVIVISGDTGCGKTTQVPQYILDDWLINFNNNNNNNRKHVEIICTQPRRISAISVAERVADERITKIGNIVGYQIRLENKISNYTRLTFCTTGILLRRLEIDPSLQNVTHVIVDEVHERSEESDYLLLILKELLPYRPDLKIILMSATMNASLFSEYFNNIPILKIPGRTFPVEQFYLEDILEMTQYVLEEGTEYCRKINSNDAVENEMIYSEVVSTPLPKDNIRDENLKYAQILRRYSDYSTRTCRNLYLMDTNVINNDLIECLLNWIISEENEYPKVGTILIFLPGIAEITSLYEHLNEHQIFGKRGQKYQLLPLHSSLTNEEQALIFKKPKSGVRKIVLSTNIAETSVTIDDCVFVIDIGKMKEKHFDPNRNMESLETVWVTRANALQRKGRAGRVMAGVCFHLYTYHRFKFQMLPQPIPEIHRIPLERLVLNIKLMQQFEDRQIADVLDLFIEPPVKENIETAIVRLQNAGALDKTNELTALGHHLATLPVDIRIGKLMLYGAIFSCIDAALTMAACLSHKSPFVAPFGKREEANEKKKKFTIGFSDHITVLTAYQKWLAIYKKSRIAGQNFANENFLSQRTMLMIADIKHQFLEFLVDIGFISVDLKGSRINGQDNIYTITGLEFNRNGENINVLSSILCAALYPNVIKVLMPSKSYVKTPSGAVLKENNAKDLKFATNQELVFIHPSSVNYSICNFPSPYLVYQEKVRTNRVYFRDSTMVPVIPLVFFSGCDLEILVRNGSTFISLENGWILFQVEEHKIAEMIKTMRHELFMLLEEKIKDPLLNLLHHDKGEKIISTILNLITMR